MHPKFKEIFDVVAEADKFKNIFRKTVYVSESGRKENDAEHTWHCCLLAIVLYSHLKISVNLGRVLELLTIHDVPEIYAGDVFLFDSKAREGKQERERDAAKKLFNRDLMKLWEEYDNQSTLEARLALAIDKLQPVIQNLVTEGRGWKEFKVTEKMIVDYKKDYMRIDPFLVQFFDWLIDLGKKQGFLKTDA